MVQRNVTRPISALDVTALLYNVIYASNHKDVGLEDAHRTVAELVKELNVKLRLSESAIESAMWACNMLHEKGLFKHPSGLDFSTFTKRLAGNEVFDMDYGYFRDHRGK